MNRVASKVAIVTGGALGIGRACALRLAEEGAAVAIFDILDQEGQVLEKELTAKGLKARYWHVDVSSESQLEKAIAAVVAHFGALDVLVNNAGVSGSIKPTHELTEAEFDHVQNINVKGVFFGTKHAIPHLRQAGGGSIINLSSIAGIVGTGGISAYHASKGAVRLMTKNDALIYAPEKIRVNSVHPGYIWTPMVENHLKRMTDDVEAARQAAGALHPLGHLGDVDDIAWAVVYLASDESKFVTGSEIVIDGGYTAR
jgi:NAD(P)-dependent dehydrogenase (short-subunit alcohol dehydrogenase family)